jgi:hypothetical protein
MENKKSVAEIMNEVKEYNERHNFEHVFQNLMHYHELKNKEDAKKIEKPFFPTWDHKGRQAQMIEHFNYYFKMTHDEKDWVKASDIKATYVYTMAAGDDDYLDYFLVSILNAKKWKDERGLIYKCVKAI